MISTEVPLALSREQVRQMFTAPVGVHPGADKVLPLEQALRTHVRPGMALHFAYSEGRPMAIGHALVRCFSGSRPGFTISSAGLVGCQAALVTQGLVKRLLVSFVGENYPTPSPNRVFQEAIDRGEIEIENQSLLVLYQRLAAGAPRAVTPLPTCHRGPQQVQAQAQAGPSLPPFPVQCRLVHRRQGQ